MRIPKSVRTSGVLLGAVLLGLMTVQGTYALWSATASSSPGTLRSSSFTVNLTGNPSATTVPMTINGQPSTLALTTLSAPLADLTPGGSIHTALEVTNASDAGGVFDIAVTASPAALVNIDGGTLAGYLGLSVASAGSMDGCAAATNYTLLTAGFTTPDIPKGQKTVLCFKVSLDLAAPLSVVGGQSVLITVPLTAAQRCGVPDGCP